MTSRPFLSRRLLLGEIGTSIGVFGSFLLPPRWISAFAAGPPPPRTALARPVQRPDQKPPPLVVLDAGHGGKDPGAIGVSGTYEKHIALAAALELKALLERGGHYQVALTRNRDVFIPLEHRVEFAQHHDAALFVSMHADALPSRTVRGASVYTLSNSASDAQSAMLATRENSADRFLGRGYHAASPEVARILASLVRRETRVESIRFARRMVGSLDQEVPMLANPDRHAGFVVLQSSEIPSVLVEMGFMSNPQDEAFLRQPAHRLKVAMAIKRAVEAYFAAAHDREMAG
jgi:N-acetylmuramoyl-L-alanine amidase